MFEIGTSMACPRVSGSSGIRKRMEKDVDEVGKIARNVKANIEALNKENLANRQKPGCRKGTGVDRSRTTMTNVLTKKFRDIMIEFQTLKPDIMVECLTSDSEVRRTDYKMADGTCIRDYIDVADLVDAHVKALEKEKLGNVGIYNIGTDYKMADGTCIRDYIDVADLVDAHVKALEKEKLGNVGIYNIGTRFSF
ncbi:hypothetical protein AgCh_013065 [Apium graveolens]